MTGDSTAKAISRMETVSDWLDSPNPILRQIATETFDSYLIPTIKAHLERLYDLFPHADTSPRTQELIAMLVLSGEWQTPSTREWMRTILRMTQPPSKGVDMPNEHPHN